MEVLTENSLFSAGEGEPMLATMLLRVNFRRLRNNLQEDNLSVSYCTVILYCTRCTASLPQLLQ